MPKNIISDAQVRINNETYQLVPNSVKPNLGLGESKVMPQSAGNGNVEQVYSEDVESKIGKVTFSVYTTGEQITRLRILKSNKNLNYITISDKDSGIFLVMKNAALVNSPDLEFSVDGKIELEFHGSPME